MKKLLLSAMLLAACSEGEREAPRVPQLSAADAMKACEQFVKEGLKLKTRSIADLQKEAGPPRKTEVTVEPNRHVPDQQDSIFRFEYESMIVQARKPGPGGDMIEHVILTQRKPWLNFPYFEPGTKTENIIAVLGEPQRREGNNLVYTCGGGEVEEPVVFEVEEDVVHRIVFNYYVD